MKRAVLLLLLVLPATQGCSLNGLVVDRLGDGLARGGSTFASDDDPELVEAAAPFSLKLMESLLAERPEHRGLRLAAARGFTQYAYAFIQEEADEREDVDFGAAEALRVRARKLYLRSRDHGLRGLEAAHPGFREALAANPKGCADRTGAADVPLLYWTAVAWASAVSLSKDDPRLVSTLPQVEALIDRALELQEDFEAGAIHAFLISYEAARQASEPPAERARRHFQRAMELGRGSQAAPLVALAEAVSLQRQDQSEFESLLEQALAIDVDADPEHRLANLVMQRRARWLRSRTDRLFVHAEGGDTP
ncbi:MAG: TRAP transporter TatT component family protein [Deltaproteobacteria bacterium]|nr:TRAP transporter TatT component family protein [Deltaproteobacteria bacterium]